ncbi:MAG: hypothetical protein ACPG1A_17025, partial [Halioglobus sp.]
TTTASTPGRSRPHAAQQRSAPSLTSVQAEQAHEWGWSLEALALIVRAPLETLALIVHAPAARGAFRTLGACITGAVGC